MIKTFPVCSIQLILTAENQNLTAVYFLLVVLLLLFMYYNSPMAKNSKTDNNCITPTNQKLEPLHLLVGQYSLYRICVCFAVSICSEQWLKSMI